MLHVVQVLLVHIVCLVLVQATKLTFPQGLTDRTLVSILCQLSPVCTSVCEFLFVFVEELCLCLNVCTLVKAFECVSLHLSCLFLLVSCLCVFVCLHWCVLVFK